MPLKFSRVMSQGEGTLPTLSIGRVPKHDSEIVISLETFH